MTEYWKTIWLLEWHQRPSLKARPHLVVSGHQQTVSTNNCCNQWLSLAKPLLKVVLGGGNRSLVARTSKCGWAISLLELNERTGPFDIRGFVLTKACNAQWPNLQPRALPEHVYAGYTTICSNCQSRIGIMYHLLYDNIKYISWNKGSKNKVICYKGCVLYTCDMYLSLCQPHKHLSTYYKFYTYVCTNRIKINTFTLCKGSL